MSARRIAFAEGFAPIIRNGRKQVTIRRGVRRYAVGSECAAQCRDGPLFIVEITGCASFPLRDVPSVDLQDDGFADADDALRVLGQWYPDLTLDGDVTVIRFKLVREVF